MSILPKSKSEVSFHSSLIPLRLICTPMAKSATGVAVRARLFSGINKSSGISKGMSLSIKPEMRARKSGLRKRRNPMAFALKTPFPPRLKIKGARKAIGMPVTIWS